MGEGIVIPTILDTSGFKKGSKELESAIKSLSRRVSDIGRSTERIAQKMISPFKRLIPTILGVGSVFGILSKAISTYMSQNEELSNKMSAIWTALGNLIGPIITQIIDWVSTAVSYFLEFLRLLGVTNKTASELSQKAQKSNRELQKTLAGFDELNVLQDNKNKQGQLKDVDPSEWMKKLSDLLKNKLWDDAADMIIGKLNDIIYKFRDKAYEVGEKIGEYLQGIVHVIARVLDEVDWKQLGVGIANFLNGLLKEVEGINFGEDLGKILVAKFTIAFKILTGFLEEADLGRIGSIFGEMIKGALNSITRAIDEADPEKIGQNIANFFNNIDWKGIANSLGELLQSAWNFAVTFLHNFLSETDFGEIGAAIREFFKKIDWAQVADDIGQLLKDAWDVAWDFFLGLLGKGEEEEPPVIKQLENLKKAAEDCAKAVTDALGPVWNDILKPILEWSKKFYLPEAIGSLTDEVRKLTSKFELFSEIWGAIKEILFGDSKEGWIQLSEALLGYNEEMARTETPMTRLLRMFGLIKPETDEATSSIEDGATSIKMSFMGIEIDVMSLADKLVNFKNNSKKSFNDLKDNTSTAIHKVGENFETFKKTSIESLKKKFEELGNAAGEKMEAAQKTISSASEAIKGKWEGLKEQIGSLKDKFGELKDKVKEKWEQLKQSVEPETIKNNVIREFTALKDEGVRKFTELQSSAEEKWKNIKSVISEKISDAKDSVTEAATTIKEKLTEAWNDGDNVVAEKARNIYNSVSSYFGDVKGKVEESMQGVLQDIKTAWSDSDMTVGEKAAAIYSSVSTYFGNVVSSITSSMGDIRNNIASGFDEVVIEVTNKAQEIWTSISDTFNGIVEAAMTWGSDLIGNFVEGLVSRLSDLWGTIEDIAQTVWDYLGFSEPEKGPLSNFHVAGPDMMKLYASGIDENKKYVFDAVNDVAEGVANAFNGNDISLPAVAGGGFLPYGVESQGMSGTSSGEVNSEVLTAILQLQGLITQFENSVENMQWVAKFGNVRAVVEEITKVQKQINRSMGV